jgi:5-methylcytosine-specific restriction protein B
MEDDEKVDIAIMQKLLPKLHGSRRKLVPILTTLGQFCLTSHNERIEKEVFLSSDFTFKDKEVVKYPLSLEKLSRMYNGVIENGFASYAEA